jgi:hypothetical protein
MGLWGEVAIFSLPFRAFLLVWATLILAATERDGATFKRKIILFLLWATEELSATVIVWATFFF